MLRTVVLWLAVLASVGGMLLCLSGAPAQPFTFGALLLLAAMVFERWRYSSEDPSLRSGEWQATEERFVDPETGRLMQVLYNPRTGERRYEVVAP